MSNADNSDDGEVNEDADDAGIDKKRFRGSPQVLAQGMAAFVEQHGRSFVKIEREIPAAAKFLSVGLMKTSM